MSAGRGDCKLCGSSGVKLVRCHLYPKSISRELAGRDNRLVALSNNADGPRTAYAHGGIYDDAIVCDECERRFKAPDDYGIDFRKRVISLAPPFRIGLHGRQFPIFAARPALLHSFAMQTWLRCYLSDRTFDQSMRNQEVFSQVRKCVLDGRSTLSTGYEVAFMFDISTLASVLLNPMLHADPEHPVYEFHLANMVILISGSNRGLPTPFTPIVLAEGDEVTVLRSKKKLNAGRIDYLVETFVANRESVERMMGGERETRRRTHTRS